MFNGIIVWLQKMSKQLVSVRLLSLTLDKISQQIEKFFCFFFHKKIFSGIHIILPILRKMLNIHKIHLNSFRLFYFRFHLKLMI
jgi:hypothetical protein